MTSKRGKNTNFRLGLDRKMLVDAAVKLGKTEKSAKKSNTKALEKFITKTLTGTNAKVPEFNEMQKRDIKDRHKDYGLMSAVHLAAYRVRKITGEADDNSYLKVSVGTAFEGYYEGEITARDIEELISRIQGSNVKEIISGVERHESYYQNIMVDYAEELVKRDEALEEDQNNKRVS